MIRNQKLRDEGFIVTDFPLDDCVLHFVKTQRWNDLDDYFLKISLPQNSLHTFLLKYLEFNFLEHIIAIRNATDDEDGIWHDDGSRFLGFSLSLNINPASIKGGELRFKKKLSEQTNIFTPLPYGTIVLFLSGIYGYEHMVSAVTEGERIVIAGWCS